MVMYFVIVSPFITNFTSEISYLKVKLNYLNAQQMAQGDRAKALYLVKVVNSPHNHQLAISQKWFHCMFLYVLFINLLIYMRAIVEIKNQNAPHLSLPV